MYFNVVEKQSKILDIKMPEIGISLEGPNVFATGSSKNSSLVALSSGLIQSMTRDEIEAVIGHEMSHVANGDMVTLTYPGYCKCFCDFLLLYHWTFC